MPAESFPTWDELPRETQQAIIDRIEFMTGMDIDDVEAAVKHNLRVLFGAGVQADEAWYYLQHAAIQDVVDVVLGMPGGADFDSYRMALVTSMLSPDNDWDTNQAAARHVAFTLGADEPFDITREMINEYNRGPAVNPRIPRAQPTSISPGRYRPSDLSADVVAFLHPEFQPQGGTSIIGSNTPTSMQPHRYRNNGVKAVLAFRGASPADLSDIKTYNFSDTLGDPRRSLANTLDVMMYRGMLGTPLVDDPPEGLIPILLRRDADGDYYTLLDWERGQTLDGVVVHVNRRGVPTGISAQNMLQTNPSRGEYSSGWYALLDNWERQEAERLHMEPFELQSRTWFPAGGGGGEHLPATETGYFFTRRRIEAISDRMEGGGFTFNLLRDEFLEPFTPAYVVTRDNTLGQIMSMADYDDWELRTAAFDRFSDALRADGYLDDIGGWIDRKANEFALDRVEVIYDRELAIALGEARDQIAIWDNEIMDIIPTGGTGRLAPDIDAERAAWRAYGDRVARSPTRLPPTDPRVVRAGDELYDVLDDTSLPISTRRGAQFAAPYGDDIARQARRARIIAGTASVIDREQDLFELALGSERRIQEAMNRALGDVLPRAAFTVYADFIFEAMTAMQEGRQPRYDADFARKVGRDVTRTVAQRAVSAAAKSLKRRIREAIDRHREGTQEWLESHVPQIYDAGSRASTGVSTAWNQSNRNAVREIMRFHYDEILAATEHMDREAKQWFRNQIRVLNEYSATEGLTRVQQARIIRQDAALDRMLRPVIYRDGSRHSLREYSNMLARTTTAITFNRGSLASMETLGFDHVRVFDGADCGANSHDDPDKVNGTVRTRKWAETHLISHPNCRRAFGAIDAQGIDALNTANLAAAQRQEAGGVFASQATAFDSTATGRQPRGTRDPRTARAPRSGGTGPVSNADRMILNRANADQAAMFRDAQASFDEVLGVPASMNNVQVNYDDLRPGLFGSYTPSERRMSLSSRRAMRGGPVDYADTAMTYHHEATHAIDHAMSSRPGASRASSLYSIEALRATRKGNADAGQRAMTEMIEGAWATDTMQRNVRDLRSFSPAKRQQAYYMIGPHEVFARLNAQYVAEKAGDAAVVRGLQDFRMITGGRAQWSAQEMEVLSPLVENFWGQVGLLR